ncbi:hypothetical protein DFQ30_010506 [Apophysomyces sp. BC1015]|nr:hypothetical protein DFQ30_010506 [Apophysomyces sp. BC1015]
MLSSQECVSYADNFKVLGALTTQEQEVIVRIAHCQAQEDLHTVWLELCMEYKPKAGIRFIRGAIAQMTNLWVPNKLKTKTHCEDWYRINVLSALWDGAFIYETSYDTIRSECKLSYQQYNDEANDRVDFIFRSKEDSSDWLFSEEKPASASHKECLKDVWKLERMREQTLSHWLKQCRGKEVLIEEFLEALAVQWHGTRATVYGTKVIFVERTIGPKPVFIHYVKARMEIPMRPYEGPGPFMSLGKCLAVALTLKREAMQQHNTFMLLKDAAITDEIQLNDINLTLKDAEETFRSTYCQKPPLIAQIQKLHSLEEKYKTNDTPIREVGARWLFTKIIP